MALRNYIILLLALFVCSCVSDDDFSSASANQKICLYSSDSKKVMAPLQIKNTNCAQNNTYCMNGIYKYGNFQYGGPASLKPTRGEVVMFLAQSESGFVDYVSFLNANVTTTMNVSLQITGAAPTNILLKDDPEKDGDKWQWDSATNTGKFQWVTQPMYTDGVIIGHIDFIDNYCIRSTFNQPNNAVQKISVMSGTVAAPVRILTVPYTSGSTFEFCQYPSTSTVYTNATCPNSKNGQATVAIVFGPSNNKFTWYNNSGHVIAPNSATITNLAPGTYHVIVNDTSSAGCTAERSVVISAPFLYTPVVSTTAFACSTKGSVTASPVGGSGSFTYVLKKAGQTLASSTSGSFSGLNVGSDYSVCVTDSCGSEECAAFEIETVGCCGDGICQANEACGLAGSCTQDCGLCCPLGTKKTGNTCVVCPAGSQGTEYNAATCDSCPANTFNAGGAEECEACPEHTTSASGSGKCIACPVGTARPSAQATCDSCGAGYIAQPCGSGCQKAVAGTSAVDGSHHATTCLPGHAAPAGSSSCSQCSIGTYAAAGSSSCTNCPSGTTTLAAGASHLIYCA